MKRFARHFTAAGLALCLSHAGAHQVWIEQDDHGARLHFGEFSDNLRETSPGLLDKFQKPVARLLDPQGEQPVALAKSAQSYQLARRARGVESLVAEETAYPAFEKKEGNAVTRTVWTPAARYVADFSARQPALTLDVLPTGTRGEFAVYYRGQPLPEAKIEAVAQSGWSRSLRADAQGRFKVALPWQGTYALEVKHTDKGGGERAGERYDIGAYVTTLTFTLPDGLASPPPPPPATPHR